MEKRYSSTLSLTSALDGVGGQATTPSLPPGKDPVPHGRSGGVRKISPPTGIRPTDKGLKELLFLLILLLDYVNFSQGEFKSCVCECKKLIRVFLMELHCCEQITDWSLLRSVSVARPLNREIWQQKCMWSV